MPSDPLSYCKLVNTLPRHGHAWSRYISLSQLTVTCGSIACQAKPSSALTVEGTSIIHTLVITPAIVAVTLIDV